MLEIKTVCGELGLTLFSEEEYFKMMDDINRALGALFDFRKQKFSDIKLSYLEYF